MREFLLELYLEHGERSFWWDWNVDIELCRGRMGGYIKSSPYSEGYKLTPKGLEYLKNA